MLKKFSMCSDLARGRREAPKAHRVFGHRRAQRCWALLHTENKNLFSVASRPRRLRKLGTVVMALVLLMVTAARFASAANYNIDFTPTCDAIYLVSLDTNAPVYEKNIDKKMYPASLTKVMAYIVVAEHVKDLDNTQVTVKKAIINSLLGTGSSIANLKADETLSVTKLLHCLMIKSGNDAALVLADYVGNGDVNNFVDMMNEKAAELGCTGTHFVNPHGLHDVDHYSTARDLATITKHAMTLPQFMDICSMSTSYILGNDRYPLVTTNSMIDQSRGGKYYYRYAKGIKTGHTEEAGWCLLSSAAYNGYSYLCVALGAPFKAENGKIAENYAMLDSKALYKWAFTNLELKPVFKKNDPISEIKLKLTTNKDSTLLYPAENYSALLPKSVSTTSIDVKVEKPESVDAPIKVGQKLGTAVLSYANKELARVDLVAAEDVDRNVILYTIQCITNIICSVWFRVALCVLALLILAYLFLCFSYNKKARRKRRKRSKVRKRYK